MHLQLSIFEVNIGALRMVLKLKAFPMVITRGNRRSKSDSFVVDMLNERIIFYRDSNLSRLQLAYNDILRMIIDGFLSVRLN